MRTRSMPICWRSSSKARKWLPKSYPAFTRDRGRPDLLTCPRHAHHGPARFVWVLAILIYTVSFHFQPMPLLKRATAFDDADWLFELKYDGYRSLAVIEHGRAQLLSRNGHTFASFSALAESISDSLPNARAVIDGEICSLDRRGRPQFKNLMFRRGNPPCFFAFDLLTCDGKDLRNERLQDRKQELRRLLAWAPADSPLKYTEYVSVVEVDNYTIPQNTYIFPAAGPICPTGNG